MNKTIKIFNISFLIIGLLISLINVFYGLDFLDTFYMGNLFKSDNIDIFRPITNILYLSAVNIFGDYIIVIRIINWLIYAISAIIFFKFVYNISNKKISLAWLSIIIMAIPLVGTNVYNGNSLTLLGIISTFICLFRYIQSNNKYLLLGLIFTLTLCLGSRFPNIVIIPILLLLTPIACQKRKQYFCIISAVFASIVLFIIINSIICDGISEYFLTIKNKFVSAENNTGGANHSISFLFQEYLHTIKDIVSNIKYLSVIFIIPILTFLIRNKGIKYTTFILFIFVNLIYIYLRVPVRSDVIHYFYMMYFYAIIFTLIFITTTLSILSRNYKELGWSLIILFTSAVGASGADTGLYYMGAPLFAFLPYLLFITYNQLHDMTLKKIIGVIVGLVGLSVSCIFYTREGMMFIGLGVFIITLLSLFVYSNIGKHYSLESLMSKVIPFKINLNNNLDPIKMSSVVFLILLVSLGLSAEYKKPFHDKTVNELNANSNISELKYIATNTQNIEFINNIMDIYNKLSDDNKVIFYGRNSAIFSYITHTGLIEGVDFTQCDSEYHTEKVEEAINDRPILILIPYNPAIDNGIITEDYKLLINMMDSNRYKSEIYNDYAIFIPLEY